VQQALHLLWMLHDPGDPLLPGVELGHKFALGHRPYDDGLPYLPGRAPTLQQHGERVPARIVLWIRQHAKSRSDPGRLLDARIGCGLLNEPAVLLRLQGSPPEALARAAGANHHRDVQMQCSGVGLGHKELMRRRWRAVFGALRGDGVADQLAQRLRRQLGLGRTHLAASSCSMT
jgi:hypothetical protein